MNSTPRTTITKQELDDAAEVAKAKITGLVNEMITGETLGDRHTRRGFPSKVDTIATLFKMRNKTLACFEVANLFDHIREMIRPDEVAPNGTIKMLDPVYVSEMMAASGQLLKALDLHKRFIEYNRAATQKESLLDRQ